MKDQFRKDIKQDSTRELVSGKETTMPAKRLLFKSTAREKVLSGATALADAVRLTLGPKSKCVLIQKKWGRPIVCNDGITIAKEVELEDPEENVGAQMIREAAERTGEAVGDGTSTSSILAHAIFAEGLHNVAAGASAVDLKRGLDRGLQIAVRALKDVSRPVASRREKAQVATISAHNDSATGEMVANAYEKVGPEGSSPWKKRRQQRHRLKLWKACSSIAATFLLISEVLANSHLFARFKKISGGSYWTW
jgi:chaperonin GroEL (HSP60 family)